MSEPKTEPKSGTNEYVGDLYRADPDGDIYGCTLRGTAVPEGFILTDNDGRTYRRSGATISTDPAANFVQLPDTSRAKGPQEPHAAAPHELPERHAEPPREPEHHGTHSGHNKKH